MRQTLILKRIRKIVSFTVFFILLLGFIFSAKWILDLINTFQSFQIMPAVIKIFAEFSVISILILAGLLTFTLVFGRLYCSTLCPLGTLQDLTIWFSKKLKKKNYYYQKPARTIKFGILVLTILFLSVGSLILVNLLDPYSSFGRIGANLILPFWALVQQFFSNIMEFFGIYAFSSFTKTIFEPKVFIYTLLFFIGLIILTLFKGRLYCNLICPVGSFLGVFSRFSLFKIRFIESKCTRCGLCERTCKASCIDSQNQKVESENCIYCFNCLAVCPEKALAYKSNQKSQKVDLELRSFIKKTGIIAGSLAAFMFFPFKKISGLFHKKMILPPGSISLEHFKQSCTACHRCVSVCPTRVIEPGLLQNGITGVFQPALNYSKSFCEYECNQCTQICPTSALKKVTLEQKKQIQLGVVQLDKTSCIVYQKEEVCGACAEVCPTRAVFVYEYKKNLYAPITEEEYCVGCGACEYACPVRPQRAITVSGNQLHLTAKKPKEKPKEYQQEKKEEIKNTKTKENNKKEFPF